ncbi:AraC family transcriptional regulator [Streptomyces lunaelactis]|uniref:AraC family transcriptional regulator n=1 Tax=Streptomyces lunaelactis TaxID=1535768 RepID=A0A2R4T7P2_9ACTN|nr:helix-turn-helix domain-containing protein [Streptomyces lunaelactis]AVZ75094.1 AraC family transcriptional regulator [Streptomyces lunaelactis]NUK00608.1 helix-turn-helix domain-containing protein [Streptomyces lunaelactis]NUK08015.1 helix-turn-helix domain-containing protein [Streptomyces lunaelactis]NUK14454.1 helix-turn-helix domain-containing protein [Streptomyces lunaelactis]NUK21476.1 helix-turn-helix domain-containing protein [Streptomyces lunaelactis]
MDVAVLAYDGVFDSGLSAILDVLDGANAMREELPHPPPGWRVTTVGFRRRVRTGAGHVVATAPVAAVERADLLLVPALAERRPDALVAHVSGPASAAVRGLVADARGRGTPVASACTGTFLLAESGVLDGRTATTSWWLAPVFRKRYPAVTIDETRMVATSDGVTTAGAAFGHVDLALAIVRMTSPALADLVARYLVVDERPSQSAYTIPGALAQNDPVVAAFERWVRLNLDEPFSVGDAARSLGVSERTLQRTVRRVLGTSPVRFVQDLRVEQASHLLRTTDLSLDSIARKVGYEHANTLRILLRERTGSTAGTLRGGR